MDMKRSRHHPHRTGGAADLEQQVAAGANGRSASDLKPQLGGHKMSPRLLLSVLLACVVALCALAFLVADIRRPNASSPMDWNDHRARTSHLEHHPGEGFRDDVHNQTKILNDRLLGGLLVAGFNEKSCLSRYESALYRKATPYKPSFYLLERLRKHEALHKKCGPHTELYNRTIKQLKSGLSLETMECNYVIWISNSGLGNRILSIASAFLYALLTNRVLLVDSGADIGDLFCEPFPSASWLLPSDFPLNHLDSYDQKSSHSYGNMLKNKVISDDADSRTSASLPSYVYLHLAHDYDDQDKLFFCEQDQAVLQKISWMMLRSDNYFVPSLFLIPSFEEELNLLFPDKDTVFHHLGRYLFHPTNSVWGLITRYYDTYLANAEERVGIQIRVFDVGTGPFQHVLDQILSCSTVEKLLPELTFEESIVPKSSGRSKAVLLTSLDSGYFEKIRNMYWEHPTVNGDIIGIYQPSNEKFQQTEKQTHNRKAWAEIYLLSLTDVLVTSSWSTFGYVAQGLGGIKPWILFKPENRTAPDPPCRQAMSIEPCFHAPPFYDCKTKHGVDTGKLVPYVRHCEDMSWGLKLVNYNEW